MLFNHTLLAEEGWCRTGEQCDAVRMRLNQLHGVTMSSAYELKSISPS